VLAFAQSSLDYSTLARGGKRWLGGKGGPEETTRIKAQLYLHIVVLLEGRILPELKAGEGRGATVTVVCRARRRCCLHVVRMCWSPVWTSGRGGAPPPRHAPHLSAVLHHGRRLRYASDVAVFLHSDSDTAPQTGLQRRRFARSGRDCISVSAVASSFERHPVLAFYSTPLPLSVTDASAASWVNRQRREELEALGQAGFGGRGMDGTRRIRMFLGATERARSRCGFTVEGSSP
jgi:hypothetical protein